ncbi:uncharacterized protein LOC110767400 isoform X2 [Prunus avium]|uniref:Uncharacterized protein LOC110767400 isoform X2 n=1 Tax=Prunus avium TaxID=42229 RepID=A0A6P5TGV7_PRUAV|nr:uncharacterized protein LOC110767400 isoform X2 [Prunus avium]
MCHPLVQKDRKFLERVEYWDLGQEATISYHLKCFKRTQKLGKGVFQIPEQEYLATFAVEDAYILSEANEETVRTIVEFVKAPDLFQIDVISAGSYHKGNLRPIKQSQASK